MTDTIRSGPTKMNDELKRLFDQMSPFQRKYSEFRAKGLKQADAAEKAGSEAADRQSLGRVGYNTEQSAGVKEYITYLCDQRAKASVIDNTEIAQKLRSVYDEAMAAGKFADANKAMELLGSMIGAFKPAVAATSTSASVKTKNNTKAFKDEMEDAMEDPENKTDDRIKVLQGLMKEVNRLDKKK